MAQQETNIPTAEEFFSDKPTGPSDIEFWAKEFTKLHVKAALKSASESAMFNYEGARGRIHYNAYPLTNIK